MRTRELLGRSVRLHWMLLSLVAAAGLAAADVRLPRVLGDHMVLQRDAPIALWGWAEPGEEVTVSLAGQSARATADVRGRWKAALPAMSAGGPYDVTVTGRNTLTLTDVLIGEVWVCSGQSNMAWTLDRASTAETALASAANLPQLRLIQIPRIPHGEPADDVNARWAVCAADSAKGFSAIAFFFGREIQQSLGVPVGLVDSSWGGTRIEPWTPPIGFAESAQLRDITLAVAAANERYRGGVPKWLQDTEGWIAESRRALDAGEPIPAQPVWRHALESNTQPTGLYNGMIHALTPLRIRGAIWYQGESNLVEGALYAEKMKALIAGWRKVWGIPDMPFYYVQLAPFIYPKAAPNLLPEIWEAQTSVLSVPHTGMAVTNDIGNVKDIHPTNKEDVGKRLALWALAKTYGREGIVYSGPLYREMTVEGGKARVKFDHAGGGLVARDGKPLNEFEIAGEDGKYVAAKAQVNGDSVLVWSDAVPQPKSVRFAWRQDAQPNLMNKEGLPASAFRTAR